MIAWLLSAWVWTATLLLILCWTPILFVVSLFDRDPARYRTGRWFRRLGAATTYINPFWDIEVTGNIPDDPRRPYVVVGNHQSQADPSIVSRLPWEMKWVAKIEIFRVPIAGWMMRTAGDIAVDRRDKRSRAEVLIKARDVLRKQCSVMFFPEGTRSRDGRVDRFNNGAFRLAIKERVPVLPIALDGTYDALPKHSLKFRPATTTMRVKVLEPIETEGLKADDAQALQERARQRIIEQIAEWRGVAPEQVDAALPGETDADRSPPTDSEQVETRSQ